MTQSITPEVIAEIRDRIEETELLLAAGASLRAVHAEALYRSCRTLLLALTEAQERAETNSALADRLESHTEQMANTSWGLTMQEWHVISNDILLAARTLRAAQTLKERKDV